MTNYNYRKENRKCPLVTKQEDNQILETAVAGRIEEKLRLSIGIETTTGLA
jgi:hypothetical protein